jgi:hypothetical protein
MRWARVRCVVPRKVANKVSNLVHLRDAPFPIESYVATLLGNRDLRKGAGRLRYLLKYPRKRPATLAPSRVGGRRHMWSAWFCAVWSYWVRR